MIKTAIIGASGFIGSHLIRKYKSKYPDCIGTSFSSDVTNLLKFDLRNPNIKPLDLELTGHKAVIITSFKANIPYCENEPRKAYEVNVEGMLQLIKNLSSNSKNIRAFVSLILANRNDKNAINSIISLTNDPNGVVRSCAFSALGHLRANNIRQEIHRGIFDSNIEAVKSASYALSRIGENISEKENESIRKYDDPDFEKILMFFN